MVHVTPTNSATSSGIWTGLRKAVAAVVGVGTLGAGVAGYVNLDAQIDDLQSGNTQLTQRLDESKVARTTLGAELEKANATVARLQNELTKNEKAAKANAGKIAEQADAMAGIGKTVGVHDTKITGLQTQSERHGIVLDGLGQEIKTATVKIGGLENEVSVSDLQDVYSQAASSAVLLEAVIKIKVKEKVKEKDDKGVEREVEKEVEKIHTHSGSGYIVAHIGSGKKGAYIGTNWHVLECDELKDADYKNQEVIVHLPNGKTVKAKPYYYQDTTGKEQIARKKEHDLILLKTTEDVSGTRPVAFASSDPKAGEAVMILGGPFAGDLGYAFNGSFGIVSGNSSVEYGNGSPKIHTHPGRRTISTARTDAAINPGNSGGLGWRVKDGKMIFMPTFIYPGEIFHGMGFGITAPTISGDVKDWIPYDLNVDGKFIERKVEKAPLPPVEAPKPGSKQSRIWDRSKNPLYGKANLRNHNAELRRYSKGVT